MIKHISSRKDCKYIPGFRKDPTVSPSSIPDLTIWEPNDSPRTHTLVGGASIRRSGSYGVDYCRTFLDVMGVQAAVTRSLWGGPGLLSSTASYTLTEGDIPTGSTDITLAAWLYLPNQLTGGYGGVSEANGCIEVGTDWNDARVGSCVFDISFDYDNSPGKVILSLSGYADNQCVNTVSTPELDFDHRGWHHIAVSVGTQATSIYLDGVKQITSSDIKSTDFELNQKVVHFYSYDNSNGSYGFYWSGGAAFADFCLYSRQLTDDEISLLSRQIVKDNIELRVCADDRGLDTSTKIATPYSTKAVASLSHRLVDNTTLMCIDGATGFNELVNNIVPTVSADVSCHDGYIDLTGKGSELSYNLLNCYDMDRGVYGDFTLEWSEYAEEHVDGSMVWFVRSSRNNGSYDPWGNYGIRMCKTLGGSVRGPTLYIDSRRRTDGGYRVFRNMAPHIYTDTGESRWHGAWHHVAVCRSGRILMIFIDGIKVVQDVDAELLVADFSDNAECRYSTLRLGEISGKVQRIKLSSVCRYSEDFTPGEGWFYSDTTNLL